MLKKVLVVLVCVMCVVSLFGLQDRLFYDPINRPDEGIPYALSMLEDSARSLEIDVLAFEALFTCISLYDPYSENQRQFIIYDPGSPPHPSGEWNIAWVSDDRTNPEIVATTTLPLYDFESNRIYPDIQKRVFDQIEKFNHSPASGWDALIETTINCFEFIVAVCSGVLTMIIDVFGSLVDVVYAIFYLLGF